MNFVMARKHSALIVHTGLSGRHDQANFNMPLALRSSAVAYFTKAVNQRLAKRPLVFNGRLANRGGLTALVT